MQLYIEIKVGEEWKVISHSLISWLKNNYDVYNFGLSEADKIETNINLAGITIPSQYEHYKQQITEWAKSTNRVFGILESNKIILSNGEVIEIPLSNEVKSPTWVK